MGNQKAIREELQKLGDSTNRPGAKVMRELMNDIQTSIEKGVTRKLIYEKLKDNGFKITYGSFLVTLKRLRKEMRDLAESTATERSTRSDSAETSISSPHNTSPLSAGQQTNLGHDPPPPKPAASDLVRPPGITPAAWTEMQQKHKAELRRQRNLLNGENK